MNSKTNYGLEEAGVEQMDDAIGALLKTYRRYRRNGQYDCHIYNRQRR